MIFDQSEHNVRCEWGEHGVITLAPISDVIIIVDIFSFSTSVEIAANQGAIVFPYLWKNETAYVYAALIQAEVADAKNINGYTLSPTLLLKLSSEVRLVLPSPNGSTLSLMASSAQILAVCLRNARAVAFSAMRKVQNIAVIPAG